MGLFKDNKKPEESKEVLPPLPTPNMQACDKIFAECCDAMYKEKRTILELEIVVGMLQNEIIINKTHNAIMAQVGRLAFVPPPFMMYNPSDEFPNETTQTPTQKPSHIQ